jgi:hypothetical protein
VSLYPAEHRAVRERHATARALAWHWSAFAGRLGGGAEAPLRAGATTAGELLAALEGRGALPAGYPAAQGVGGWLAALRTAARDLVLERNQALRLALLDVQHVTTLLGYLAALAEGRGDVEQAGFHREWEARLRTHERAVAEAVLALATSPEEAVAPADLANAINPPDATLDLQNQFDARGLLTIGFGRLALFVLSPLWTVRLGAALAGPLPRPRATRATAAM